ncbi:MAG: hypothetical protein OMM_08782 [Candidatus Magnetoglobus multicellularis str. Araruama]|uniref:Phasin domain-containing protein n=1 Tax=Candidatus Magnetoglobus multicellularis str. Araruama TaxID=890399 RepID=A0A1V1P6N0_9BACT|nr:MAG: hypothetical protein OMM_08782 [Candidatus Magnetoglobus multicellularis str. Araruama]
MDQKRMFKQMIDFQKSTFDNAFNAMSKLQEQGEKMVNMFLTQSPWMPEDGKQAVQEWINTYKKGRDQFKATVEENFKKVQEYFSSQSE